MCGIVALFNTPKGRDLTCRMTDRLVHRGPDGEGTFSKPGVELGSRRLRILDLDERADMPVVSEDGESALVYNGEIYNYRELKKDLDYPFQTSSDSELLFAGLFLEGRDFLKKVNGMFAFAFYDGRQQKLIVGRDRLGIKPLFYAPFEGGFVFASELRAFREIPELMEGCDSEALYHYLSLLYVPEPLTIYPKIKRFPAAHVAEFKKGNQEWYRYWDLPKEKSRESESDLREAVQESLKASLKKRLISDVPLGLFLSAGLDSNILAGSLALDGTQARTFSMGFEGGDNESPIAQQSADHWGLKHQAYTLDPDELWQKIPQILEAFDEPYAGGLPTWFLSREVSKEITVALSGTGGDEMFGNYGRIQHLRPSEGMLKGLLRGLRLCGLQFPVGEARDYLFQHGAPLGHYHHEKHYPTREWQKRACLLKASESRTDLWLEQKFWEREGEDLEDRLFRVSLETQLKDEFLYAQDILSMDHSLEIRVPFLDHEFVELMYSIPSVIRSKPEDPKCWSKSLFKKAIPQSILEVPKSGFMIPYGEWMRGALKPKVETYIDPKFIRDQGIFNSEELQSLWQKHLSGQDCSYALWAIFMFQLWWSKHQGLEIDWS